MGLDSSGKTVGRGFESRQDRHFFFDILPIYMKRVLITGCLKSGMGYITKALSTAGVKVGEKKMGPDGNVDWRRPYSDNTEYDITLHQVREPLADIEASLEMGAWAWNFICSKESRITMSDSVLLRSMKYWLYWNQRAQAAAEWTYRVESMPEVLDKILKAIKVDGKNLDAVEKMSKDFHKNRIKHEAKGKLTFGDILAEDRAIGEFVDFMGKSYGYKETI